MHSKLKTYTSGDRTIWVCVILLFVISLPVVYSSTNTLAIQGKASNEISLFKQVAFIALGLLTIYFTHKVDYKMYARIGVVLYWASIPLLIYTYLFGVNINNAQRWVAIPGTGLTIQTSEIAKTALILYLCKYLASHQDTITLWKRGFLPALVRIIILTLLVLPSSLSSAIFIGAIGMIVLYIGRARLKHIFGVLAIGGIAVGLMLGWVVLAHHNQWKVNVFPYGRANVWVTRIDNYLYASEENVSYQVQQSKIAIAKGGLFGVGPGNSTQKNFLPSAFSDYIFSIIVEEYGILGACVIFILYLLLGFRAIQVFRKCPYTFGALVTTTLCFDLLFSALFNVAVNGGLLPVTGVTLPLLSRGGTSFLITCFKIGIILSVSRVMQKEEPRQTANVEPSEPIPALQ